MGRAFWEARDAATLMQEVPGLGMELWGCRQGLKCPCHGGKGWDGEGLPEPQAWSVGATEKMLPPRASHPAQTDHRESECQHILGAPGKVWDALALVEGLLVAQERRRGCSAPHRACVCELGCDRPALSELQPVCFLLY